ncbi:galactose-specific lectin nattectin-like [Sinocyclocheilus grahami]|uniref:galactose-specific lectin nattectin-like n=1 Tax=Sinocyclocheilus grahami TaxID=75366 RepID=UPI0007AD0757|nr:PREDICTED: galactose-specific lectin nattectin-like [Sinocyclocheilus grahami]
MLFQTGTTALDTKIDGKCASTCDCQWSEYKCRCFRFFTCQTSWIDAEKQCLDYNGNLASVHTHAEYTFIQNLIKSQTQASTEAWIGGYGSVSKGNCHGSHTRGTRERRSEETRSKVTQKSLLNKGWGSQDSTHQEDRMPFND